MVLSRSTYCLASRTEFASDSWTLALNQLSRLEKINWLASQKRGTVGMSVRQTDGGDQPCFELGAEDVSFSLEDELYEVAQDQIGQQQKEQDVQIDEHNQQDVAKQRRL